MPIVLLLILLSKVSHPLISNKLAYDSDADELGVNITDSITPTYANVIVLSYSNEIEKEGYALDVKNNIITLTSNDAAGMFYAAQTLSSVISGTKGRIPELRVVDAPRFRWRGMQIDVARNFHSVVDIKRLIKAMSMYKMNVLHLHLTDDEGWRLVIDGLPELTQVSLEHFWNSHI
ncbi:hypothetical protein DPMN_082652 [Dreissena polymorpha]|uniref:beta-N-acetylhexosaminidase n=1 Tax=Dreissena polymorpha TaxID=45954 RepID=A0A9D4BAC1_DREPO|nr:hypothetical protein DPMN_082652 [Dreissena polymorpha]